MSNFFKSILCLLVLSCFVSGCGGNSSSNERTEPVLAGNPFNADGTINVAGLWNFEITPDAGLDPDDEDPEAVTLEDVALIQNGNIVEGSGEGFSFQGVLSGDTIEFDVIAQTDEGSEQPMSHFTVSVLEPGTMIGSGLIIEPDSKGPENSGSFGITGLRVGDAPPLQVSFKSVLKKVCKTFGNVASMVIGKVTKRAFRPMGDCWGEKNGNGYYVFGHTGPGSALPVWTQTVYFPWGFALCSVRTYNFDIRMGGHVRGFKELIKAVKGVGPLLEVLGYRGMSLFTDHVSDFIKKHGNFAVSLGYSTRSHNVSVYVNVEGGSSSAANHPMIKKIVSGLNKIGFGVSDIEVFSGKTISDSWRLRRGPVAKCASPLYFIYLFGTNKVEYD